MTPVKSSTLICDPMPNMMICNNGTMSLFSWKSPMCVNVCGKNIDIVTAAKIHNVNEKLFTRSNPRKLRASRTKNKESKTPEYSVLPNVIGARKDVS